MRPDSRIGVVVLTHNRVGELCRTLEKLARLPEKPEIVVVDNASTDGTASTLQQRFPDLTCLTMPFNMGASARNAGVRWCRRAYVALCDDDTWWEAGSLARAADAFDQHPTLAVVTASVRVGEREVLDPTCIEMQHSPLPAAAGLPGKPLLGFLAGASAVRRDAFLAAGGFDQRLFLGGEEELLAYDLADSGWQLVYLGTLMVHHDPSPSRDAERRRRLVLRNRLLVAWLRRPLGRAVAMTAHLTRLASTDSTARAALLDASTGLGWALRTRRVVRPEIERGIRTLETQRQESAERRP